MHIQAKVLMGLHKLCCDQAKKHPSQIFKPVAISPSKPVFKSKMLIVT